MNILITCAGRRNYMVDYFKEALRPENGKVFATNSSEHSTALLRADKSFIVPSLYDPSYIDVLIDICMHYEIEAIIPLFDLELPVLAKAKERLAESGIKAVVSSAEVVEICNDKWKTNEFLINHGLQVPITYIKLEDALEAIAAKQVSYPLIVKPRWGMGSIGLMEAEDESELCVFYKKALRIINRSYLASISSQELDRAVLIQEKLSGDEYGLDVVNDLNGKHIVTFVKKKLSMRSGETDGAETVDNLCLRQLGEQVGTQLGHVANLDIDLFVNVEGNHILEMNPRFGGGYPFSHLAGANIPAAIIAWLRNDFADTRHFKLSYNVIGYKGILPLLGNGTYEHS